jgi:hypothetical protein
MQFVLVSESPAIKPSWLYRLAKALEINLGHCADAHDLKHPAVDVIDKAGDSLPRGCHPIVFTDQQKPGFLGIHSWDPFRKAAIGKVFVTTGSGLMVGRYSIPESAAHEALEAFLNPRLDRWIDHPTREGIQMPEEACDVLQTHYFVRVPGSSEQWPVANFIHPHYFSKHLAQDPEQLARFFRDGGRLDHSGELKRPGEVGSQGYTILRERVAGRWRVWNEGPEGNALSFDAAAAKDHPLSRTRLLGAA